MVDTWAVREAMKESIWHLLLARLPPNPTRSPLIVSYRPGDGIKDSAGSVSSDRLWKEGKRLGDTAQNVPEGLVTATFWVTLSVRQLRIREYLPTRWLIRPNSPHPSHAPMFTEHVIQIPHLTQNSEFYVSIMFLFFHFAHDVCGQCLSVSHAESTLLSCYNGYWRNQTGSKELKELTIWDSPGKLPVTPPRSQVFLSRRYTRVPPMAHVTLLSHPRFIQPPAHNLPNSP